MKTPSALFVALALSAISLASSPAVTVSAAGPATAKAGKTFIVNVKVTIPEGYHIYGPKDESGVPTSIVFAGPKGFSAAPQFPKTSEFKGMDGTPSAVYFEKTTIPVKVTAPKNAKGKQTLKFKVTTQACNDHTCLPPATAELTVTTKF